MTTETSRLGTLERQIAVIEHRMNEFEGRHDTVPTRVTKLEQQFENMTGQLKELNKGQQALTLAVNVIGSKVGRLLTILTLVGAGLQMVVPALLRVWFP
ncbi:hypothetical protein [Pseudomonas sp. BW7P1]|uniref:hypothetical protein n=1 Tax=Pseudomonas TaxID=286 RepID=UPI0021ADDD26|nr:hypothetical protein [Pseudomonas sp. BW7P1]UWI60139.1 hypothetical protein NWV16_18755 [Pseudomonas sp. BW7P1]